MPSLPPNTSARRAMIFRRVGRAIAGARKAHGLSQPAAAEALGVSVDAVRSWEGGRRLPALAVRKRIVESWGVSPKALMADRDECPHCGRVYE